MLRVRKKKRRFVSSQQQSDERSLNKKIILEGGTLYKGILPKLISFVQRN
jgi:hypothetical protein